MPRADNVSLVFRLPLAALTALQALTKRTRIRQSEYLREAVEDLLSKYENPDPPSPPCSGNELERATHVLVPRALSERLNKLSKASRVSQSEYLREAVADLLLKYPAPK